MKCLFNTRQNQYNPRFLHWLGLACLGLLLAIPGRAYADNIDCTDGAQLGYLGLFQKSLISNCEINNRTLGLVKSGGNISTSSQTSSNPQIDSPQYLGNSKISFRIIDMGSVKPEYDICRRSNYFSATESAPAVNGHWYCAKFEGSSGLGYLFGGYWTNLNFVEPNSQNINCNIGALGHNIGITNRNLFGRRCTFGGSSSSTIGIQLLNGSTVQPITTATPNIAFRNLQSTDLGSSLATLVFDMGLNKPNISSCYSLDYQQLISIGGGQNGHWYCTKFVGSKHTGYLLAQVKDSQLLNSLAVDCTRGAEWSDGVGIINQLIGSCTKHDNLAITMTPNNGTTMITTSSIVLTNPFSYYTSLGYRGVNKIIDMGNNRPTFEKCATANYVEINFIPAIEGHWYCAQYPTETNNGYLFGQYLNATDGMAVPFNVSPLDFDANGEASALTDGLLLLRYLFGFQDDSLINGAVAPNANRTSASDIKANFEELLGQ